MKSVCLPELALKYKYPYKALVAMGNRSSKYPLDRMPNELKRLEEQHNIIRLLFNGNYNAPLEEALRRGIRVLDAGCGSGIWTLEMSKHYPASQFIGTDFRRHILPNSPLPPNCLFLDADTVKGLPFSDNTFDFVFQRLMWPSFSRLQWNIALKELVRVTKPGGIIELVELEAKIERAGLTKKDWLSQLSHITDATLSFQHLVDAKFKVRGIDMSVTHRLPRLAARHLENVYKNCVACPLGWNGQVGDQAIDAYMNFMAALVDQLAPEMGLSKEEYKQLLDRKASDYGENRAWMTMLYVYGAKRMKNAKQKSLVTHDYRYDGADLADSQCLPPHLRHAFAPQKLVEHDYDAKNIANNKHEVTLLGACARE
ncbi:S-adenosyl-L-methionine-dependent methyltransferase [Endogone sp. FLAS-F59071]|nr:S-adenosyl-L-methionine-dependent methyltransferase [Endogone sp. FLAS-F59071]|eukprot:RUS22083.1 S-adenosyl-L-methionine-dependent methyltransferase [Endogone sp. FLAS-F59071]